MKIFVCLFLTTLFHSVILSEKVSPLNKECLNHKSNWQSSNISALVIRNRTEWVTHFLAEKNVDNSSNGLDVKLKHIVLECGDRNIVRVFGVMKDFNGEIPSHDVFQTDGRNEGTAQQKSKECKRCEGCLLFHQTKKGRKIAFSNDGMTAYRMNPYQDEHLYGSIFTNRFLRCNELFELRLDKSINITRHDSIAIGVTLTIPSDIASRKAMLYHERGNWALWHADAHSNGQSTIQNYPLNLGDVQDGERIGVMRKCSNRNLHFFKDGYDMGVGAYNVPETVYGFFDLRTYATQVTLIN